jgi:hypothetical protein
MVPGTRHRKLRVRDIAPILAVLSLLRIRIDLAPWNPESDPASQQQDN